MAFWYLETTGIFLNSLPVSKDQNEQMTHHFWNGMEWEKNDAMVWFVGFIFPGSFVSLVLLCS